jgi:hypothetical protein
MRDKKKTGRFIAGIVAYSIIAGFLFSFAFHLFRVSAFEGEHADASFWETFSTAFWFGPVTGLIPIILRFTLGRIVEETIQFESKEDFSKQMKEVLGNLEYRPKSLTDDFSEWECKGDVSWLFLWSVFVKIEDNRAKINGPWAVVNDIKKKTSRV